MSEPLSPERLRAIVQDAHLNFLIGAGTPSAFFALLGGVEDALTAIERDAEADERAKRVARASVQAFFFDGVVAPNLELLDLDWDARAVLRSYGEFGRTLNRILIERRNSLLSKKVNLFTTNIDLAFEIAFERIGLDLIDGFSGSIRPVYDLGVFGSLHFRTGVRYEHRSEAPTFDLYKLHGSVGWQLTSDPTAPAGIAFDNRLSDVRAAAAALETVREHLVPVEGAAEIDIAGLLAAAAERSDPDELSEFLDAYQRLTIVNPEKQKFATTVLTETYYELIRRFANALERENSVLFVHGFSFRDEHLRKIVVRCARANPTLQVIVFCYSTSDQSTYRELMPEEQIPNSNLLFVTPIDEETPLDLDEVVNRFFRPLGGEPTGESERRIDAVLPRSEEEDAG